MSCAIRPLHPWPTVFEQGYRVRATARPFGARWTLTRPTARPRPSSYARLAMHLRDTGQTGGVIQTPRGEMRWGDQCEPWLDPYEGRCCCGKEECS